MVFLDRECVELKDFVVSLIFKQRCFVIEFEESKGFSYYQGIDQGEKGMVFFVFQKEKLFN